MPVFWLSDKDITFPHPGLANEDGILAVGGDLSKERLLESYRYGIFPWYNPGDPILWWSPDPRFVLFPKDLKVSKSMRPYFNQKKFTVTYDQQFEAVMTACMKQRRRGQSGGSWISEEMIEGYVALHKAGYAHSVEVWKDGELAGGLYGVSLGKIFFGESMFMYVSNASKFGFITLVRKLTELGFVMIDCQQRTPHLESLGAKYIPRTTFVGYMERNHLEESLVGDWERVVNGK